MQIENKIIAGEASEPRLKTPLFSGRFSSSSKFITDFKILFTAFLLGLRTSLPFLLFFQTVVPVAFVFAMGHYAGYLPGTPQLVRIIAGTITFNLAYLGLMMIASRISWMRENGTLLYYSALPISKTSFVAALLFSRVLINLPNMIVPILSGMWMYNLELHLDLWLVVIIALGTFSLTVIGTALGVLIKNHELLLVITNSLIFIMALASPTFMSSSALPLPLQILGWLMPTTYISDAINHSLQGIYDLTFFLDMGILLVQGVVAAFVIGKFLDWRSN